MKCLFSHFLFIYFFFGGGYIHGEKYLKTWAEIFFISEDAKKISAHQVVLGTF